MPSTYTSLLRLEDQANGENDATWGNIADSNFLMVEHAIAGRAAVTHDDTANYALTTANNSADEARRMILNIGGALSAARNTVCPTSSKVYVAKNATTGGFATTLKTTAGTGISIPNGKTTLLFCDGTNVVDAIDYLSSLQVGGTLTFTPANASATLSPTGTGTVTINPATAGAIDNVNIGANTRGTGAFTTLTATAVAGALSLSGATTSNRRADISNTGGTLRIGVESSAGGAILAGSTAYAGVLITDAAVPLHLGANGVLAMTISTAGAVTIDGAGASRATGGMRIGADSTNNLLDDASTGAGTATLYIGNASINVTSDRRLKANIKGVVDTYSDAAIWDMVDRSRVVTHTWNDPSDKAVNNRNTRGLFIGLIAQEQKEVTPWAVNKPFNDKDPWFIEHVHLVPLLMRDAQITHEEIKVLKAWKGRAETALAANGITVH